MTTTELQEHPANAIAAQAYDAAHDTLCKRPTPALVLRLLDALEEAYAENERLTAKVSKSLLQEPMEPSILSKIIEIYRDVPPQHIQAHPVLPLSVADYERAYREALERTAFRRPDMADPKCPVAAFEFYGILLVKTEALKGSILSA